MDTEQDARLAAMVALGRIKDRSAVPPLIACLHDRDMRIRVGAIETLAATGDPRAIDPIRTMLQDRFSDVREAAQRAITKLAKKQ
jgi:bilin biosynthesis PecE protein